MELKKTFKTQEKVAGMMYLLCMVASISGGLIIDKLFSDTNLVQAVSNKWLMLVSATGLEIINALGVLAIAVSFHEVLKQNKPTMASAYLCMRTMEAAFTLLAAFVPMIAVWLLRSGELNHSSSMINNLLVMRDVFWAYIYPIIFVGGGAFFYWMLRETKIVPAYIANWGLVALIGVLGAMFMPEIKMIPGILIIANELYLGTYLLIKGINEKNAMSVVS
ncbi:MAG: hypothetical protein PWP16_767 [Eubacteriaceae bacterium]|jgi:hypothetical protein|nr:hypothetical protein [Eubacteriaceae bacterium]MDN5307404.1 hypothetical protein [Eubacteriaceae bacterium]